MVAIVGKSGSGKSTLLHILGTLDRPNSGRLQVGGTDVFALSSTALAAWRNARLGFVFQFHHLLPEFTALENVAIPGMIAGMSRKAALRQASTLLDFLQLTPRADHKPGQLSGGEQQRVAIGRALMNAPDILLADEPTGNLDTETSAQVHQLLRRITTDMGKTLVVVTHNPELAGLSDIVFEMRDGLLLTSTGE
jgi:lipoprotein-releasing system ATP-binding protein